MGQLVDREICAVCDMVIFYEIIHGLLLEQEGVKISMQLMHGRI